MSSQLGNLCYTRRDNIVLHYCILLIVDLFGQSSRKEVYIQVVDEIVCSSGMFLIKAPGWKRSFSRNEGSYMCVPKRKR